MVDGVRRAGVWDGEHQRALELELQIYYNSIKRGRWNPRAGPSNAGDPPSMDGGPRTR